MAEIGLAKGSYEQYKNDTSIFMTWLSHAAQACGYFAPPNTNPIKEMIVQAKCIVSSISPTLHLPNSVSRLASRAIRLRKLVTSQYRKFDAKGEANEKHEHFTGVLEEALDLLLQHRSNALPRPPVTQEQSPLQDLTNRFSLLEVEDCEDYSAVAAHLAVGPRTNLRNGKDDADSTHHTSTQVNDDRNMREDLFMRIICFLMDVHKLERQVMEIWRKYKAGTVDIVVASAATNAAIVLVERLERQVIDSLPSEKRLKKLAPITFFEADFPYSRLIGILLAIITGCEEPHPKLVPTKAGEFFFFDTSVILTKFCRAFENEKGTGRKNLSTVLRQDRGNLAAMGPSMKPYPRVPLLLVEFVQMCATRDMEEDEIEKIGNSERFRKIVKADVFLTQLLMETFLARDLIETNFKHKRFGQSHRVMIKDEFTRTMMKLGECSLTTHMVFAATMVMRINEELGAMASRPFKELRGSLALGQPLLRVFTTDASGHL
ncbi:hypothetical protein NA57DRAFT_71962 [Rhizodiscina lignyota]|uniref:DUF6604 domain-containing protein n=1 Tax=Rhizodiscina lignyota TaxID=1504668 RepID=A0A9P4IJZ2_9PEZI|nr:hypothetical protein NA57DRAFT_71962 [Rhizodiscina lignyota]